MKILIFIVVLGLIGAGCSTTTYLNLAENDKGKISREVNAYEKDKNAGAEVNLLLQNGTEIEGELLSVRDSALLVCTKYSATEEELANSVYPILFVKNNEIQEMTLEGSSYVWTGLGIGYVTGAIGGYLISQSSENLSGSEEGIAALAGIMVGGLLGVTAGGIIGYALSKEEFILQEIPPGYNFYFLKNLARYEEKEPEYLKEIK